jgi:hypothetical protein
LCLVRLLRLGCGVVLLVAAVIVLLVIVFLVWELQSCAPMGCGGELPMGPTYALPT